MKKHAFGLLTWLSLLPLSVVLPIAGMFLHEWWVIQIVADPAVVSQYHFGSESMLSNGGKIYAAASTYAAANFREGLLLLLASMLFIAGLVRRSTLVVAAAYVVAACAFAVTYLR